MWVCAGAHAAQERVQAPLQTNLIAYASHRSEVKEWYHYPHHTSGSRPRDAALEDGGRADALIVFDGWAIVHCASSL